MPLKPEQVSIAILASFCRSQTCSLSKSHKRAVLLIRAILLVFFAEVRGAARGSGGVYGEAEPRNTAAAH
jgi:hypothetical protein